jgi:hypothetical protein
MHKCDFRCRIALGRAAHGRKLLQIQQLQEAKVERAESSASVSSFIDGLQFRSQHTIAISIVMPDISRISHAVYFLIGGESIDLVWRIMKVCSTYTTQSRNAWEHPTMHLSKSGCASLHTISWWMCGPLRVAVFAPPFYKEIYSTVYSTSHEPCRQIQIYTWLPGLRGLTLQHIY